ncbi:hypothetical protein BV372_21000 [Nostoc sp. T09]|uniref:hypothetical protein n=1 Tax=Nostoc sp. T09 TaxID=1932621 RepID=UPI000A3B1445|nr:hypothetical protein [Nostoc sp. T09]OUL30765.1 hypothetical protein BV372_21000 [Nostoc sp. T09]
MWSWIAKVTGQRTASFESIVINAYYSRLIKIFQFDLAEFPDKTLTLRAFAPLRDTLSKFLMMIEAIASIF